MASRGNSLIDRRLKRKHEEEYQKRIKNVKGQLNLTPPRNMTLNIQLNRLHVEQERQAAIDKQNLVILERLTEIKKNPARVDHVNKSWKPSNDRLKKFRERRQRRIELENAQLAERLKNAESYYNAEEWERDYKRHLYYLSLMENTTKDYDSVEYEDDDFENENSEEEEEGDNESLPPVPPGTPSPTERNKQKNSDEEDNVSLPPIDEKGKKNEQNKEDKQDGGNSEHVAIMDAEELHTAIEENDKDKILEILGRTSEKEQMEKLCHKYKEMYNKDLLDDLESKVDEDVKVVLEALLSPSSGAAEDAKRLNEAVKGLGTDEDTIIEILCTRNNKQLAAIREEYQKQFEKTLEEDLKGDTSGDVEKLLVELSKGERDETDRVDEKLAKKDAETLIEAGIGNWGTDEGEFIRIFTQRSLPQLAAMYEEYKKLAEMDIAESIDKEMDGDLQKTFLAIVKHSRDPSGAQSDKLTKSIEEGDTTAVAKIILPMNKEQLSDTCSSYKKNSKRELVDDIEKKCKGDLQQILLSKLGKEGGKKKDKDNKEKTQKNAEKLPAVGKRNHKKKKEEERKGKESQQQKTNQAKAKENGKENSKSPSKSSPAKKQAAVDKEKKDSEASSALHKAIEANDKKKIKEIIIQHAADQTKLKKLADSYKKEHKKDLLEAIDSKLDEDLHEAVAASLLPPSQADARSLYLAMKGLGTDETVLIEILCTRTNSEIEVIKNDYKKLYESTLEDDVKSDTSGDFENLLVALLQGKRDEGTKVNEDQAHKDAETLIEAGIKKWGTDESSFIEIFTTRSSAQLQAMFPDYLKWAKCDIEETISSEMEGDLQNGLLTLVRCVRDPLGSQVNKLHSALQEGDTTTVARTIAGTNEATMKDLESAYNTQHKPKLYFEVEKRCSADLRKILLPKLKDKAQEKPAKKSQKLYQADAKKTNETKKKDGENDSSKLHNAIEKNNKKTIKEIILRSATEKSKIKKLSEDYEKQHKAVLIEQLDSKIDDDILEAVTAMVLSPAESDARVLFYAMKGVGTKEEQLIEILCTRNNQEIQNVTKEYREKYGRSLEEDIKGDTSGDFEKLLADLLKGKRDESTDVDEESARKDASALYEAGVKKLGTDEDKFIDILTGKSNSHLQSVMAEYEKLAGVKLQESIQDEMDGDLRDGLVMLLSCVQDGNKTQADKLHAALQDGDTSTVARVIAGAEKDKLAEIEASYNANNKPKLYFEVNKKCSEDLKKLILHKLQDKKQEKAKTPPKSINKKQSSLSKNDKKPQTKNAAGAGNKKTTKNKEKESQEEEEDEVTLLYKAIERNDKKKVTEIVVRNATEKDKLVKLQDDYNKKYSKDLVEELDSKMDDDVHEAVAIMILPPAEADARSMYYAMKGVGTNEVHLIEILCTKSNEQMAAMKKEYQKKYGRSLEQDVKSETSGDFENLLTALMKGDRSEASKVDEESARKDASALYEAGVKKLGTDEDKFIDILTSKSNAHLQAVIAEYENLAGVKLQDSIQDEMDGDLRDGLVMLLSCAQDGNKTQADKLHAALQDGDTSTVARVIAGADEDKMKDIEDAYNNLYDPKLYFEVDKKCSEDLKKIILDKLKDKSETKKERAQQNSANKNKNDNVDKPADNEKPPNESNNTASSGKATEENQQGQEENGGKEERPKINVAKVEYHGTIVAAKDFDAEKDAEKLKTAMKGFGSDEDAIIEVLSSCSSAQRQEIIAAFKQKYDKDLIEELKSELSGKFEDTIVGLLSTAAVYDAISVNGAMEGLGTNEGVLAEIICSRSSEELQDISQVYKTNYSKDLVEAVKDETSGDLCDLLTSLLQAKRPSGEDFDEDAAYGDAQRLYEAGEKKWGTDESMFVNILTTRSIAQLKAIFQAYKNVSKKDILESIDDELEGDFQKAVKVLVTCMQNPPEYFAESLHEALTGVITSNSTVSRIIITRCEIDLVEIKKVYQDKYGKSLLDDIKDSLKGDQETLLLKLLGD